MQNAQQWDGALLIDGQRKNGGDVRLGAIDCDVGDLDVIGAGVQIELVGARAGREALIAPSLRAGRGRSGP